MESKFKISPSTLTNRSIIFCSRVGIFLARRWGAVKAASIPSNPIHLPIWNAYHRNPLAKCFRVCTIYLLVWILALAFHVYPQFRRRCNGTRWNAHFAEKLVACIRFAGPRIFREILRGSVSMVNTSDMVRWLFSIFSQWTVWFAKETILTWLSEREWTSKQAAAILVCSNLPARAR